MLVPGIKDIVDMSFFIVNKDAEVAGIFFERYLLWISSMPRHAGRGLGWIVT